VRRERDVELVSRLGPTSGSTLYRGRLADGTRVLVKRVEGPETPDTALAMLRSERDLLERLPAGPRPVALVADAGSASLVLQEFSGDPLEVLLHRPLPVDGCIAIAAELARALADLHAMRLVHRDLRPANVLADPARGLACLVDLSRAAPEGAPAGTVDGDDLTYVSPERTGRVGREVDGRSDLYSLGVLLYRMLTGELPFTASDALEWVHCHVARQPCRPSELGPVPRSAVDIAMKLLAKSPEDRYQSALGVAADLEQCLARLRSGGGRAPFALGTRDVSERFQVPRRLYGREAELQTLAGAFRRVADSGAPELVFIAGYSGIGKSSLVAELRRPVAEARAQFGFGKVDRGGGEVPYAPLAAALSEIVKQILAESEEGIASWRARLLAALGAQGQLVIDLVPKLALVIGPQPVAQALPPVEAQQRFQRVFQRFLGALASTEHPLVLFLDDLQWVDPSTLALLEHLATQPEARHVLLLGAYRDNEVGPSHPLAKMIEGLRQGGVAVKTIVPRPLSREDANRLVADTLRCEPSRSEPLTRLVYEKTEGNPFFFTQLLTLLHEEGSIAFDRARREWGWNLQSIEAKGYADNVVELMVEKLRQLPEPTRRVLRLAGCLGDGFDLETLALVDGAAPDEVEAELAKAVGRGYLHAGSGGHFGFVHDRVQEAAYALVAEKERPEVHLRIGRLLLDRSAGGHGLGDRVFEIVSHLERGAALLDAGEKVRLAELDLEAGRRAQAATAYRTAAQYHAQGQALLPPDCWRARYSLTYALALERARCEWLSGDFAAAEEWIAALLREARSRAERADAYRVRIDLLTTRGEVAECARTALEACAQIFGLEFPLHPAPEVLRQAIEGVLEELTGREVEALLELPAMTDPGVQALLALISSSLPCAFFTDPALHDLIVCTVVRLSLRHGNSPYSAHGYVTFGLILGHRLGRFAEALRFSRLACDLVERDGFSGSKVAAYFLAGMLEYQSRPPADALRLLRAGLQAAVDGGDANHGCYCACGIVQCRLMSGERLADVAEEAKAQLGFARSVKYAQVHDAILVMARLIESLRGTTRRLGSYDGPGFDDEAFAAGLSSAYPYLPAAYHGYKVLAELVAGNFEEAVAASVRARPYVPGAVDHPVSYAEGYRFFTAVALAGRHDEVSPEERRPLVEALLECEARLRDQALHNPGTFGPRHALVAAEVARIEGRHLDALRGYEEAIAAASEGGFVYVEALASEFAAHCHARLGLVTGAAAHLRAAHDAYRRWGADAKVSALEAEHPELRAGPSAQAAAAGGAGSGGLDFLAVARASQAISEESALASLLDALMRTVIESAGAQAGWLILARGAELSLAARATAGGHRIDVQVSSGAPGDVAELPGSILSYVRRTREWVILSDAAAPGTFSADPALRRRGARSVLCLPIVRQGALTGLLYLENNLVRGAFTRERLAVLELLAAQAAISLQNDALNRDLEKENAERERAEEALRESQRLMKAIFDSSKAIILVKDLRGRFLLVNRRVEVLHRMSNEEIRGKTDYDLFPRETADAIREADRLALAAGAARESEAVLPEEDGLHTYLSVKCPVYGEDGEPCALCVVSTDITERKRAEAELTHYKEHLEALVARRTEELTRANASLTQANRELEQAQTQLLQSEKMASIGQLAAGVAHEINNPVAYIHSNITSLEGYLRDLLSVVVAYEACEGALPGESLAAVRAAKDEADFEYVRSDLASLMEDTKEGLARVKRIVHALRCFSHVGESEWQVVDLRPGIDSTLNLLRAELERKARVIVEHGALCPVECLSSELNQVFMNLLVNAAQAIAGRGTITVRTGSAGEEVWVEVADTGEGIPPEDMTKIFDPFFTTKPVGKGTGLGLSLSYGIVQKHHGRIEVESEPGRGARFRVCLPVRQPPGGA
jgi:PAS domain S-box-containing protein